MDEDGERFESAHLAVPEQGGLASALFDEPEEVRVCSAVVSALRECFKPDETPSTSDLLEALKGRVSKNKLYVHRQYGRKCGLFDWRRSGKCCYWSLGPNASKTAECTQSAMWPEGGGAGLGDDPSDVS